MRSLHLAMVFCHCGLTQSSVDGSSFEVLVSLPRQCCSGTVTVVLLTCKYPGIFNLEAGGSIKQLRSTRYNLHYIPRFI